MVTTNQHIFRISQFEYEVDEIVFEDDSYKWNGMFGKFEIEIAAAELLRFSKEAGEWVGVEWSSLASHLGFPESLHQSLPGNLYDVVFELRVLLSDEEEKESNLTGTQYQYLLGLHMLVAGNMARLERRYKRDNDSYELLDVIFPNPSMISRVGDKQRIASVTE